jgi:F-type H+-transporting ATPase subunit b
MTGVLGDPEFWVLIAALLFVALVWKRARETVVGSLDTRAARIRSELDAAVQLREEAERALAEYQAKQREGAAEAEAIVAHARAEAERIAAQSLRDLEESSRRRELLGRERIAQEQAKAVAEIRATAVDIAIAASRRVIAASLDEKRGAAMIDQAIAALPGQFAVADRRV